MNVKTLCKIIRSFLERRGIARALLSLLMKGYGVLGIWKYDFTKGVLLCINV
jgi:hypothetical protein